MVDCLRWMMLKPFVPQMVLAVVASAAAKEQYDTIITQIIDYTVVYYNMNMHHSLSYLQTVCESLSLGTILTYYDQPVIIKAFVLTTAVFIGLTAYAMQSKHDFSTWGAA